LRYFSQYQIRNTHYHFVFTNKNATHKQIPHIFRNCFFSRLFRTEFLQRVSPLNRFEFPIAMAEVPPAKCGYPFVCDERNIVQKSAQQKSW